MNARAKVLVTLLGIILAVVAFAFAQERRQQAILEAVRSSLAIGDSKEAVERVLHEQELRPEISKDGRSYTAHVWFHFRPDVSVIVTLNEQGNVDKVVVEDRID